MHLFSDMKMHEGRGGPTFTTDLAGSEIAECQLCLIIWVTWSRERCPCPCEYMTLQSLPIQNVPRLYDESIIVKSILCKSQWKTCTVLPEKYYQRGHYISLSEPTVSPFCNDNKSTFEQTSQSLPWALWSSFSVGWTCSLDWAGC